MKIIARLRFAWYLWREVRYDGTFHRISPFYAITWAWDDNFWRI